MTGTATAMLADNPHSPCTLVVMRARILLLPSGCDFGEQMQFNRRFSPDSMASRVMVDSSFNSILPNWLPDLLF